MPSGPKSSGSSGRPRPASRYTRLRGEQLEPRTLLAGELLAANDEYTTSQDVPLQVAAPGILANDTNLETGDLSTIIVEEPKHGSLTANPNGGFTYTPFPDYSGPDRFTYRAKNGDTLSTPAIVSLIVNFVPDASVSTRLLVDINTKPLGIELSGDGLFEAVGDKLFFEYEDLLHGKGIWRTDGTTAGTFQIFKYPSSITNGALSLGSINNTFFFAASDGEHGQELWKTDGTVAGTVLVKDIRPLADGSSPAFGVNVNGVLFFRAQGAATGFELWKSDGTAEGTVLVKDTVPGTAWGLPYNLINVNGTLFFSTAAGLWKSDGTESGTVLVKSVSVSSSTSIRGTLANIGGLLFFSGQDKLNDTGYELWKSDGTEVGTVLVKNINVGNADSSPSYMVELNGELLFRAQSSGGGSGLWKSDGTEQGTQLVTNSGPAAGVNSVASLINIHGIVYFSAFRVGIGDELWKTDGTSQGTTIVRDIGPGSQSGSPHGITNVNGTLMFAANDGVNGRELWKSDGTESGTQLVKDLVAGFNQSSAPNGLLNVNGTLYFCAKGASPKVFLWKSDGTAAGTIEVPRDAVSTQDAFPAATLKSEFVGSLLYVTTNEGLWRTDGTPEGTVRIFDSLNVGALTNVSGTLFFIASDQAGGTELWKTDGTTTGTVRVRDINPGPGDSNPRHLANLNGALVFQANDGSVDKLWKSDGTAAGTIELSSVRIQVDANSRPFVELNGSFLFSGNDGVHGYELWKTNGTSTGTVMVSDLLPGAEGSGGVPVAVINGALLLSASNGSRPELWKSDGTAAGTARVASVFPIGGETVERQPFFTSVNGVLYFRGFDSAHGIELWRSDGTETGTMLVKDIQPGTDDSKLEQFQNVNGVLMFLANDGTSGTQLWKSDGTELGTVMVSPSVGWDLETYAFTGPLGAARETLYLAAYDDANGVELWQANGTAGGTHRINILPGPSHSSPKALLTWNGRVIVSATDGIYGHELRTVIDINGAPSGQNGSASVEDIATYSFSLADFGFVDPTDTPTNSFLAVKLQSLPAENAGLLLLNDQPVAAGQSIHVAAIAAGQLRFQPTLNSAVASASFAFQVQDDGGTADGGTDTDPTPDTFSLTILRPAPWQNRIRPNDVNGDRNITAGDALEVINYINAFGAGLLPERTTDLNFYDVNADNQITAADALAIINHLNSFGAQVHSSQAEGEESTRPTPGASDVFFEVLALESDLGRSPGRRRGG